MRDTFIVSVPHKLFSRASAITNIPSLFREIGLLSIDSSNTDTVEMMFDVDAQDAHENVSFGLNYNKALLAGILRGFDVEFMLQAVINISQNRPFFLYDRINEDTDMKNVVVFCDYHISSNRRKGFQIGLDYVTSLYPKCHDIKVSSNSVDFYVLLPQEHYEKLGQKVMFWEIKGITEESLREEIINKTPLEE